MIKHDRINMEDKEHMSDSENEEETSRERSDERKFICTKEGCGKQFTRPYRLQIHLRTHTGERPFRCEEPGCNKSYCRQTHLLRHQHNAHRSSDDEEQEKIVFRCEEDGCGREFTQNHNLQKHLKRQHSIEALCKYKCQFEGCQESFRKHHQLRAHSYTHTNVDPYTCSHPGCLRTFQTTTRLRRHLKTHQGYMCGEEGCDRTFSKWTELRRHKSSDHVEEHKCKECGKTFPKRHLLNDHHRSRHEERSPLPCPHKGCDRMYWDRRNLKAHIRRYHEAQRFVCDEAACGKMFASKQKLDEHSKTHSPDYSAPVKPCKDKKKPGRKKKSMASKLSGISDMEVQPELEPAILEIRRESEARDSSTKAAASETGPQHNWGGDESVVKQTDWGKVLKLRESLPSVPNSCSDVSDSLVSEDRNGEESMDCGGLRTDKIGV